MGLTERHWFENEEPELTEQQLEDIVYENKKAYDRGYAKGYSDRDKEIVRYKDIFLEEEQAKEITSDELNEWKHTKNRDPLCIVWYEDKTPIWVLEPNKISELAFLGGYLKIFNKKPTKEQLNNLKWNNHPGIVWKGERSL